MGTTAAIVVGAVISAATAVYSADTSRRQANQAQDAAKARADEAERQAEELAKLQATRDKTVVEESEAIGRLDLGEEDSIKARRAKGKAAFIINKQDAAGGARAQIGTSTPGSSTGGLQL
jgi:gas vesicle protein